MALSNEAKARITCGEKLDALVSAIDAYCTAYAALGDTIGNDGYSGGYAADMLNACHQLLSAEIGMLDGGTMSRRILQIAETHGLVDEHGNISAE